MTFQEKLKEYIDTLSCAACDLCEESGLSAATISRYRSGERIPKADSPAFFQLCASISRLAMQKGLEELTEKAVIHSFLECSDMTSFYPDSFREKFNTLFTLFHMNTAALCQHTNYDASTISRIRTGSRQPSEPFTFAEAVADYVIQQADTEDRQKILLQLLNCTAEEFADKSIRKEKVTAWLLQPVSVPAKELNSFLTRLDEFDLDEYIQAIHFDTLKVPSLPFQLPTSKTYYGLSEMMDSELDFLKATVLSKSGAPVIMYSDMPMEEMAKDPDFPKKWMYGMAMMLKKGLHLHQIHNLDRSFEDMLLGLESWIPMYMTGQISPYYLKEKPNNTFLHLLKVSGAAALSGEAICGFHENGKYYLTKNKEELSYYQKRADNLLASATPLMDIYLKADCGKRNAFLLADALTEGKRQNTLSAPPLYTIEPAFLEQFLKEQKIPEAKQPEILNHAASQRQMAETILQDNKIEETIYTVEREEFERHPISLSLSGLFYEKNIPYTYDAYLTHLEQTKQFAVSHPNYSPVFSGGSTFRNLQIFIHSGQWAMISKEKSPAIHFVIHHPKLLHALEHFTPPVTD